MKGRAGWRTAPDRVAARWTRHLHSADRERPTVRPPPARRHRCRRGPGGARVAAGVVGRAACRVPDPPRRRPGRRRPRRQPRDRLPGRRRAARRAARRDTPRASCCGPSDIGSSPRSAGASGPLYGTAFLEAGVAAGRRRGPRRRRRWPGCCARPPTGLARRGRCAVGDKTILDTLAPAADAFAEPRTATGRSSRMPTPRPCAQVATARARRARSSRGAASRCGSGERSVGHLDPGRRVVRPPAPRARRPLSWRDPIEPLTDRPWSTRRGRSAPRADRPARARAPPRVRGRPARGRRPLRPVPAQPAHRVGRYRRASSAAAVLLELVRLAGAAGGALCLRSASGAGLDRDRVEGGAPDRGRRPHSGSTDLDAGRAWVGDDPRRPGDRACRIGAPRCCSPSGRHRTARSTTTACGSPSSPATSSPSPSPAPACARRSSDERHELGAIVDGATDLILQVDADGPCRPPEPGRGAAPRDRRRRRRSVGRVREVLGCEVAGGHGAQDCPLAEVRASGEPIAYRETAVRGGAGLPVRVAGSLCRDALGRRLAARGATAILRDISAVRGARGAARGVRRDGQPRAAHPAGAHPRATPRRCCTSSSSRTSSAPTSSASTRPAAGWPRSSTRCST